MPTEVSVYNQNDLAIAATGDSEVITYDEGDVVAVYDSVAFSGELPDDIAIVTIGTVDELLQVARAVKALQDAEQAAIGGTTEARYSNGFSNALNDLYGRLARLHLEVRP